MSWRGMGSVLVAAALAGNASGAPSPTAQARGTGEAASAAAAFAPASTPPVVERSDWEMSALEPPGRIAVPGTVQGLLWTSGLAEERGSAVAGASPGTLAREGDYVFSFDGQLGEAVAFVASDGLSTFVGKGKGVGGGDTEKLEMLRPGVANEWRLTAAAHIVELEVSRRRGRPALPPASTSNLIASKVHVLDERAFAGSVAAVINWAARDFEEIVHDKGQAALFDSLHQLGVHPSWWRHRRQLAIRFVLRAMGPEPRPLQCAPCMPNYDCACAYGGVALAAEYLFDARSRLLLRTFYLPRPQVLTVLGGQIL